MPSATSPFFHNFALGGPTVKHPLLGTTFTGVVHPCSSSSSPSTSTEGSAPVTVHQYRGIKYASLERRFRQSKLQTRYESVTDARIHGPICPQPVANLAYDFGLPFEPSLSSEPSTKHPRQDEFECLNLNITCPAPSCPALDYLPSSSKRRLPVMVWIHGHHSGSDWLCDAGRLVRKSVELGLPVIVVALNFRMGLLGSAASQAIHDDNVAAGTEGVGNYGLRDQRTALEWIHHNIGAFGGDAGNVTLFGSGSGAHDILCHLLSPLIYTTSSHSHTHTHTHSHTHPHLHSHMHPHPRRFHRAIVQSGVLTEQSVTTPANAGWQLRRLMGSLGFGSSVEEMRAVEVGQLVEAAGGERGSTVDDGWFLASDWRERLGRGEFGCDVVIGDNGCEAAKWEGNVSRWTTNQLLRRVRAVLGNPYKADTFLSAYNISPYTADEDLPENLLDLLNDALYAYPIDCTTNAPCAASSKSTTTGQKNAIYRYVFDQGSPFTYTPHRGVEVLYLFDNIPLRSAGTPPLSPRDDICRIAAYHNNCDDDAMSDLSADDGFEDDPFSSAFSSPRAGAGQLDLADSWGELPGGGGLGPTDEWMHLRVRDALQSAWLTFAAGTSPSLSALSSRPPSSRPPFSSRPSFTRSHSGITGTAPNAPWNPSPTHVFVFGPEGETGERSRALFESRRRVEAWKAAFDPLGMHLVHKLGVELSRGPATSERKAGW